MESQLIKVIVVFFAICSGLTSQNTIESFTVNNLPVVNNFKTIIDSFLIKDVIYREGMVIDEVDGYIYFKGEGIDLQYVVIDADTLLSKMQINSSDFCVELDGVAQPLIGAQSVRWKIVFGKELVEYAEKYYPKLVERNEIELLPDYVYFVKWKTYGGELLSPSILLTYHFDDKIVQKISISFSGE